MQKCSRSAFCCIWPPIKRIRASSHQMKNDAASLAAMEVE
jgi:hypothetical protein